MPSAVSHEWHLLFIIISSRGRQLGLGRVEHRLWGGVAGCWTKNHPKLPARRKPGDSIACPGRPLICSLFKRRLAVIGGHCEKSAARFQSYVSVTLNKQELVRKTSSLLVRTFAGFNVGTRIR